jgi:hypothetical protein
MPSNTRRPINHADRRSRRAWLVGGVLAGLLLAAPAFVAAKHFSPWGLAAPEVGINSAQADGCPIESPNGLDLYLASTRPGAVGGATDPNDIWFAHRASKDAAWGEPQHLPAPVNSAAADFCPTPLNGNRLLFVSTRGGGCGAGDMYMTRNNPEHGWETPVNLGCYPNGPNFPGGEFSPSLVETDQGVLLYYSSSGASPTDDQDIYVSTMRADGSFGPGSLVEELSTASNDQMPNVSRDGQEIVFSSDRPGGFGMHDVYAATRASASDPWSAPENLGSNVNTAAAETRASLSGDRERLHFGRLGDIWVSTREKITGSD